ncbi:MAG: orotidine 5'-phosphate decarboxylase / HUMPS family protein [Nitrososphaeria archaeon]|jgi:3-hexulose-6-phosphate synthase/6-phospho-3-hexuloisomerase
MSENKLPDILEIWAPKLQIAFDILTIDRVIEISYKVENSGVDILEAGTPLIKSVGIGAVKELKKKFPKKIVLADLKTLDVGRIEVCMAADAGADIVSVSALAPNEVIVEALAAAEEKKVLLEADLLGVEDQLYRALVLKKLGVDIVCVHTAIDQEKSNIRFEDRLRVVKSIAQENLVVSAAGGLNIGNVGQMVEAGANIIVVGRALTNSAEPSLVARQFKNEMMAAKEVR